MKRLGLWVALSVAALVIGCNQAGTSSAKKGPPPSTATAKSVLEDVAKTGRVGSGMMALSDYVANLSKSDPAKGEALAKEIDEMKKLSGTPDAMKAKAKEIADKL